jgi:hypothetical protein
VLEVHEVLPGGSLRLCRRVRTNSWVKQWVQILLCRLQNANLGGVLDTGNVSRTLTAISSVMIRGDAGSGVATHGVLVGTSAAAPTRDDFNLNAQVQHGNGAGQLSHALSVARAPVAITGGYRVTPDRQFANNSGAPITVAEVALVARHTTSAGDQPFLILHDLVSPAEVIPDGAARVFKYHLLCWPWSWPCGCSRAFPGFARRPGRRSTPPGWPTKSCGTPWPTAT